VQIASLPGGIGKFAVFETVEAGYAAQTTCYSQHGAETVRVAISKLTPETENNLTKYLNDLQNMGVNLDQTVDSQFNVLMPAVRTLESGKMTPGTTIQR
jgi:hypothetical protein